MANHSRVIIKWIFHVVQYFTKPIYLLFIRYSINICNIERNFIVYKPKVYILDSGSEGEIVMKGEREEGVGRGGEGRNEGSKKGPC